jgi:hypothetical protein
MDRTKEIKEAVVEQAVDGEPHDQRWTTGQAGSGSFPELVRAHFDWERAGCSDGADEQRYRQRLREFEAREGEVSHVYWATRRPSAVALTVKPKTGLAGLVSDHDALIRLHRVTDWLVRERRIADLLHHCDTLAIKVSQVLRGTPERIAMQWLYAVQSHLLGFIERTHGRAVDEKQLAALVESQKRELIQIEKYYTRAAEKAARIVYFWGMMIGVLVSAVLLLGLAGALWITGWFDEAHTREVQTFLVAYIAGGVGAIVSVLMRMSSNKFRVDFEVGRTTVRRLGSFRPFIGVVFGIALYFLLLSGIPRMTLPEERSTTFFFFGTLAFLAGFNERWTNVLFGQAERTIAASLGDRSAQAAEDDEDGR